MLPTGGTPVKKSLRVDINCIREEFEATRDKVPWQSGMTCINYKDEDEPHRRHTGLSAPPVEEGWHEGSLKEGAAHHRRYTNYNPEWDGTLIKSILEYYDCFAGRIMLRSPCTCYTWHDDRSMTSSSASVDEDLSYESFYKLHIPIYSDPGNYFAFDSGLYRLEPGWVYIVDPTREHTFFNASMEDRYHIMGGTDMKKREAAKWSNKDRGKPAGFDSIKHELNKEFFI
jgi:hypothetical protein